MIALVIASTFYDVNSAVKDSPKLINQLLLAFSIKHNFKYLKVVDRPNAIKSISGIRQFSFLVFYLIHFYAVVAHNSLINKNKVADISAKVEYGIVSNAKLFNVFFLTMAGMLTTESLLKRLDGKMKINRPKEAILRFVKYFDHLCHRILLESFVFPISG
jgi:hypothetical protein